MQNYTMHNYTTTEMSDALNHSTAYKTLLAFLSFLVIIAGAILVIVSGFNFLNGPSPGYMNDVPRHHNRGNGVSRKRRD